MTLLAIMMVLTGVTLLYFRWCRHTASQGWWVGIGWLLILLAIVPWWTGHGGEFAVMYTLLVPGALAWGFVTRQGLLAVNRSGSAKRHNSSVKRERQSAISTIQLSYPKRWGMLLLRSLIILPFAGSVSLLATVALTDLLPWIKNDTLVLALLGGSFVWGIVASWVLAQASLLRPLIVLSAVGLLSALYLFG